MAGYRKKRLEEQIKRIIGEALLREVKDPRIGFVTVYSVELSDDYEMATVKISVLGDDKQKKKSLAGLVAAKGFIRSFIGKNMQLRFVPDVIFKIDTSIEDGVRLVGLIESVSSEKSDEKSDDDDGSTDQ
ncbi:MAG: 30S ribosome-binding factor RbfA [Spirochaetes bacterium]|nr:30S ribosome-binding factor RbfA [Spirochaetota bacterium]